MKLYYPDYYTDFSCIAGACRHSCCRGWEIDIDKESLKRYRTVGGKIGKDIRAAISREGTPHFILREDERCPFLREDGLCRMIVELGEDSLCDICAEHPRFYNEYSGAMDAGLGACCEEVSRLIVGGTQPTHYCVSDDGNAADEAPVLQVRAKIWEMLASSGSLTERMERCMAMLGGKMPSFDWRAEAEFLLSLERMDEEWTACLEKLLNNALTKLEPRLSELKFERIAEYFVFRHFAVSEKEQEMLSRLLFAFYATMLVCAVSDDTENVLRLFSAEIEYSDENVDCIVKHLSQMC